MVREIQNINRQRKYKDGDQISIKLNNPQDMSRTDSNDIEVRAEIASLNDISKIELWIDGVKIREVSGKTMTEPVNLSNGSHTITVKGYDTKGNATDKTARIGVKTEYQTPTPTQTPTSAPTPIP
jgi:hypothetical protein